MTLGPKVGEGRQAEVFVWRDGSDGPPKVLKLFKKGRSRESVEREVAFTRAASEAGIPTPRVYGGIIEWGGRLGIVYERIVGQPLIMLLLSLIFRMRSYARMLAGLHFNAHGAKVSALQTEKERLKQKIARARTLTVAEKSRLTALTDSMPDGESLCHNDFYLKNVIIRTPQEGGPVIIDWEGAAIGDPTADLAQARWLAVFGWRSQSNGPARWFVRWLLARIYRFYSQRYFELSGVSPAQVDRWMTVISAARIDDDIPGLHEHLVRYVRARLAAES